MVAWSEKSCGLPVVTDWSEKVSDVRHVAAKIKGQKKDEYVNLKVYIAISIAVCFEEINESV